MSLGIARCLVRKDCWFTVPIDRELAEELAVAHVVVNHPDEYVKATGKKLPEIDEETLFHLQVYTVAKEILDDSGTDSSDYC